MSFVSLVPAYLSYLSTTIAAASPYPSRYHHIPLLSRYMAWLTLDLLVYLFLVRVSCTKVLLVL